MGKTSAKTKAAAHQMSSALSGEAGILNTLQKEHKEVSSLMEDCLSATEDKRPSLFKTIQKKLLIHAQCEEQVFYPACRSHDDIASLIDRAENDHERVETLLGRIDKMEPSDPSWKETLRELQASVKKHVGMEENEVFPRVQSAMENAELRTLDTEFKKRKKQLQEKQEKGAMSPSKSSSGKLAHSTR